MKTHIEKEVSTGQVLKRSSDGDASEHNVDGRGKGIASSESGATDHCGARDNGQPAFSINPNETSGGAGIDEIGGVVRKAQLPAKLHAPVEEPPSATSSGVHSSPTFLDDLRQTVQKQGQNTFATWYDEKGNATTSYSFRGLWEDAGIVAYHLRHNWNANKGDRVVLCYNFGLHFFASLFGCLRAGVVPVLVYPPGPPLKRSLGKLGGVVSDCDPILILTDSDVAILRRADQMNPVSNSRGMWPNGTEWKVTDKVTAHSKPRFSLGTTRRKIKGNTVVSFDEKDIKQCDVAFLQYTSGSTGKPKGVMVTFGALQANANLLRSGVEKYCSETGGMPSQWAGFSWLPQYHDLGLILAGVTPFASGYRMHMMSPVTFLKKPLLWLHLMSRHRVSWSVTPDFAIHYVARKFNEAKTRNDNLIPGLDLSSIRFIKVTAEPVRASTPSAWDMLLRYGLREDWFSSGYGLAEHVVGCFWVRGAITSKRGAFIACGRRRNFHSSIGVKIVSTESLAELPDGEVGEIWLAGPSVAAGYFGKREASDSVFRARLEAPSEFESDQTFLRTGDLGFFEDDYLFICGREKDLIIHAGVNYFPQDIEYAAQDASTAVRPGCVAAFSSDETQGDGVVEVVFEIRRDSEKDAAVVCRDIHAAVSGATGLAIDRLVAIKEKSIPKTTSGKIRRRATRSALHGSDLDIVHEELRSADCSLQPTGDSLPSEHIDSERDFKAKEMIKNLTLESMMDEMEAIVKALIGNNVDLERSSNIFDVGIDSLSLVEMSKTLESRFGIEVADTTIIDHPTIADLSMHLYDKLQAFEAIMKSFFGPDYDSTKTWADMGLFSADPDQLRNAIDNSFAVGLDANCFETHDTPEALKAHVLGNRGVPLKVDVPNLAPLSRRHLPWSVFGCLQFLGSLLLIIVFALPIVPAWYFAKIMESITTLTWIWLPFIVPVWMAFFSLMVITIKWAVIWKYKEGKVTIPSHLYLKWWFVDRAVALWEFWTGRFLLDTPLIKLFYLLMGAKINRRAMVKAFVREFDLVEIHQSALIESQVHCRKFGVWNDNNPPSLRFRRIQIGEHSIVKGMVSLGSRVGHNTYIEKLSVVPEGACVPDNSHTVGNPAFVVKTTSGVGERQSPWLAFLKLTWLYLELYHFFGAMALGQYLWVPSLPSEWRYAELLMRVMLIVWASFVSIGTSLIIKWAFIGRRRPGQLAATGLWSTFSEFAADWHFNNAARLLLDFTEFSRFWNAVYMALGMDLDFSSIVAGARILPSNADLLAVKRSFVSAATFCGKSDGSYCKIKIEDSSVGYRAHLGPSKRAEDINIIRATVFPYKQVNASIARSASQDTQVLNMGPWKIIEEEALASCGYGLSFGLFLCTLIPPYELWVNVLGASSNIFAAVPMLAAGLILQMLAHTLLVAAVQFVTLYNSKETGTAVNGLLYRQYQRMNFAYDIHSFVNAFRGSPAYNYILRILGVEFVGQALLNPDRIYEYSLLTVADKTIVDGSQIHGHYVVYGNLKVGPCEIAGVMHPGVYATNSLIVDPETKPFSVNVGTFKRN